jgi:hypothetical protein
MSVRPESNIAFKEWAAVCAALASGRQSLLLRKGGIDEGREGFRIQHREFWLLPTQFHQDVTQLAPEGESFWEHVQFHQPPTGKFRIDLFAVVEKVFEVSNLAALTNLAGQHILSDATVEQRFNYRRPGLFVLAVRAFRAPQTYEIEDSPYIAGCRSWVELTEPLPTKSLRPVLDEREFAEELERVENSLSKK